MADRRKTAEGASTRAEMARQFLTYYYPIHYKAGIKVEDALRGGELGRHQVAILWLIHNEGQGGKGKGGREMRRKDIEKSLKGWFEISGAAITKAIRGMAAPPLELVRQEEDPTSGREKTVRLTPKGERYLDDMIDRGTRFIELIVERLSERGQIEGLNFFQEVTDAVADIEKG